MQRRDDGLAVDRAQRLRRDVLGEQELEPVEELGGRGLLLQPRHLAHLEEHLHRLERRQVLLDADRELVALQLEEEVDQHCLGRKYLRPELDACARSNRA
jgi:hypothetical protein